MRLWSPRLTLRQEEATSPVITIACKGRSRSNFNAPTAPTVPAVPAAFGRRDSERTASCRRIPALLLRRPPAGGELPTQFPSHRLHWHST